MVIAEMRSYIATLTSAHPGIKQVWLIGSRANGTAQEDSDWDFLLFADEATLTKLRRDEALRRQNVDLLVVYNDDDFVEPWPTPEKTKSGSLSGWKWRRLSEREAEYKATKWVGDSGVDVSTAKACRVWP